MWAYFFHQFLTVKHGKYLILLRGFLLKDAFTSKSVFSVAASRFSQSEPSGPSLEFLVNTLKVQNSYFVDNLLVAASMWIQLWTLKCLKKANYKLKNICYEDITVVKDKAVKRSKNGTVYYTFSDFLLLIEKRLPLLALSLRSKNTISSF